MCSACMPGVLRSKQYDISIVNNVFLSAVVVSLSSFLCVCVRSFYWCFVDKLYCHFVDILSLYSIHMNLEWLKACVTANDILIERYKCSKRSVTTNTLFVWFTFLSHFSRVSSLDIQLLPSHTYPAYPLTSAFISNGRTHSLLNNIIFKRCFVFVNKWWFFPFFLFFLKNGYLFIVIGCQYLIIQTVSALHFIFFRKTEETQA